MPAMVRILVVMAIVLSAFAQITMKCGMSMPQIQKALASMRYVDMAWAVGCNPRVLCGLLMYAGSMVFWLFVLARLEVSQAYPFVGLGIVVTSAFGFLFLGETMTPYKIAGTVLVALGIGLLACK